MEILITKRLTLRSPLEVDADDLALFLNNHKVSKMLAQVPFPYDRKDALEFIEARRNQPATDPSRTYMIFRERLIGCVGLRQMEEKTMFGYWLAEPFWGQGLMSEAAHCVLDRHFADPDAAELEAHVFVDNPASQRVLAKLGFEVVGSGETFSPARDRKAADLITRLSRERYLDLHPLQPQKNAA
ncbi:MAG: GNAT family N-acetyltransferase [Pseudomonadota bacterium]